MKVSLNLIIGIIAGALLVILYTTKCSGVKVAKDQGVNLMNALYDSLHILKTSDSTSRANILVIQTERASDFLKLRTRDSEILQLQSVVSEYKDKLKEGNSVTLALLETIEKGSQPTVITKIDTVEVDNDKGYGAIMWPTYQDSVKNEWLDYKSTINKDSATRSIAFFNKFSVVVGNDKKGPFADITTYNPYSNVKVLRTYQVAQPQYKAFGVGGSVGVTYYQGWKPYIGVGINYTPKFLRF